MGISWAVVTLGTGGSDPSQHERHWAGVTGYQPVPTDRPADVTLVPSDGDPILKLRSTPDVGALHLELGSDDVVGLARSVRELGGTAQTAEGGRSRCASPGGLVFEIAPATGAEVRPRPATWPDGRRSIVDQVCLDAPGAAYDAETAFWTALTGWERRPGALPEFQSLVRPAGMPFRFLLQRLDEPHGRVRAHLDLACDDVDAEQARHEALGARTTYVGSFWRTLVDPAGRPYCLTPRDPVTGTVG